MLTVPEKKKILPAFNKTLDEISGSYAIVLIMRDHNDPSKLSIFSIPDQPCWGGFRKYRSDPKVTFPCTQPDSWKPPDLFYNFPDGIPEVVGFSGNYICPEPDSEEFLKYLFSNESPFVSGFNNQKYIKYRFHNDRTKIVIRNTEFDPTVTVAMLFICVKRVMKAFNLYRKLGLSKKRSLFLAIYCIKSDNPYSGGDLLLFNRFYPHMNITSFLNNEPRNLSEGFLRDGYDYHREQIEHLFADPDKPKTNVHKEFESVLSGTWNKMKAKQINAKFDELVEKEKVRG